MRVFLFVIFFFQILSIFECHAQIQQFTGDFKNGNFQGIANYEFRVDKKDTILNGSFDMRSPLLPLFDKSELKYFKLDGQFNENKPTGRWSIISGEYLAPSAGQIVERLYQVALDGVERKVEGNFLKGIPEGAWKSEEFSVDSAQKKDARIVAELEVGKSGNLNALRITQSEGRILGKFGPANETGMFFFPLKSTETDEVWWVSEGVFKGVIIRSELELDTLHFAQSIESEVSDDSLMITQAITLVRALKVLNGKKKVNRSGMENILQSYCKMMTPLDSICFHTTNVHIPWKPFFSVAMVSLSDEDVKNLELLKSLNKKSDDLINPLVTNTQIQLLSKSDTSVYRALQAIDYIKSELWKTSELLLSWKNAEIISLLAPELLNEYLKRTLSTTTYQNWLKQSVLEFNEEAVLLEGSENNAVNLAKYTQVAMKWMEGIQRIDQFLNDKIKNRNQEEELDDLESSMMIAYNRTVSTIDSLSQSASEQTGLNWGQLRNRVENPIRAYASMENYDAKKHKLNMLPDCYNQMNDLLIEASQSEYKIKQIERAYTDKVWNPYTYTTMEEVVKKRLFNAYRDVLMPDWIEAINTTLDCDSAKELKNLGNELNDKMLSLRNSNTSYLERKLKKNKKACDIWILLNLNPVHCR